MKKIALLLIALLYVSIVNAQDINIVAGVSYGGPKPTEFVDSTSGKPLVGAVAGFSLSFPLSERLSFSPGMYYSFRGLDYSQSFTRDTMFTVEINGTIGEVPSFYTAYVNGKMSLHYFEVPLLIEYRIWKFKMTVGPYVLFLIAGKDC